MQDGPFFATAPRGCWQARIAVFFAHHETVVLIGACRSWRILACSALCRFRIVTVDAGMVMELSPLAIFGRLKARPAFV